MECVLRGAEVYTAGGPQKMDLLIRDGAVFPIHGGAFPIQAETVDCGGALIFPGFLDVHVHLREPGFSYKETIASGTRAAAHGGYTAVCAMPNLNPVPDSPAALAPEREAIAQGAVVPVYPYGALTVGERGGALADLEGLAPHVVAFSDDGRGVQDAGLMREAMRTAKRLGKIVAAHCEDNHLVRGGYIHDGAYARAHGHKGICSESEYGPIARDLDLVRETGCAYHVCHVSTKESVALIRRAKREGLDVTCETSPTYLLLDDSQLQEDGRFKMNPPIRSPEDRLALLEAVRDGTIDIIATDHAPHSAEEKARGLAGSAMGVVGLECAFPLLYTYLVEPGLLTLGRLVELMHTAPRKRFGIGGGAGRAQTAEKRSASDIPGGIAFGQQADLCVWDLHADTAVDPDTFLSQGKSTPFAGWKVHAQCKMTVCKGEIVWQEHSTGNSF